MQTHRAVYRRWLIILDACLVPACPPPSARPVPRPSRGDGWNILADIEVFIFAVEAELEAMDRERVGVHRRGCKPDLSLRRRVIGLIWMLTFGGMQWRIAGLLSALPDVPTITEQDYPGYELNEWNGLY